MESLRETERSRRKSRTPVVLCMCEPALSQGGDGRKEREGEREGGRDTGMLGRVRGQSLVCPREERNYFCMCASNVCGCKLLMFEVTGLSLSTLGT